MGWKQTFLMSPSQDIHSGTFACSKDCSWNADCVVHARAWMCLGLPERLACESVGGLFSRSHLEIIHAQGGREADFKTI